MPLRLMDYVDQTDVLRLQTDNLGHVWYGDDLSLGINSEQSVEAFFSGDFTAFGFDSARSIRLLGTWENAELIVKLMERITANPALLKRQKVLLGSPAICQTRAILEDPASVLQYLWQPEPPSSLSCQWHTMTKADYCSYVIIRVVNRAREVTAEALRIATHHPAWPAITFVPHVDRANACLLLAYIVDPRWFANARRPHRTNRLLSYLGLTRQNIGAVLGHHRHYGRHFERAQATVATWYNTESVTAFNANGAKGASDFLWRIFMTREDPVDGILASTKKLVSLLHHYWVNAVLPPHPEMRFQPSEFFKTAAEVEAFEKHRRM